MIIRMTKRLFVGATIFGVFLQLSIALAGEVVDFRPREVVLTPTQLAQKQIDNYMEGGLPVSMDLLRHPDLRGWPALNMILEAVIDRRDEISVSEEAALRARSLLESSMLVAQQTIYDEFGELIEEDDPAEDSVQLQLNELFQTYSEAGPLRTLIVTLYDVLEMWSGEELDFLIGNLGSPAERLNHAMRVSKTGSTLDLEDREEIAQAILSQTKMDLVDHAMLISLDQATEPEIVYFLQGLAARFVDAYRGQGRVRNPAIEDDIYSWALSDLMRYLELRRSEYLSAFRTVTTPSPYGVENQISKTRMRFFNLVWNQQILWGDPMTWFDEPRLTGQVPYHIIGGRVVSVDFSWKKRCEGLLDTF